MPDSVANHALECVARGIEVAFGLSEEFLDGSDQILLYCYNWWGERYFSSFLKKF